MLAESVWFLTLICLMLLALVFVFVVVNSSEQHDYAEVQASWYRLRSKWVTFLVVLGVVVSAITLLPFPVPDQDGTPDATVVNVVGYQWYWEIDKTEYAVGETVEFHVTSADSNHGFGLYDEDDHIVTQTQAMPNYVNKLTHTFDKPGTYKVLCMEYCGLAHHSMLSELTVR